MIAQQDYLLDTGIANLAALDNPRVLAKMAQATFLYVPAIVLGELYFGAYFYAYRHQSTKFLDRYDTFYARNKTQIILCDEETAQIYGAITAELRAQAQPIQQNDVWIAALARQHSLTLATVDTDFHRINRFHRISRLAVEIW